jgi:hypothetical protein
MILRANSDFFFRKQQQHTDDICNGEVLFYFRYGLNLDGIWKSFGFKTFSAFFALCARNERTQGWLCLPSVRLSVRMVQIKNCRLFQV